MFSEQVWEGGFREPGMARWPGRIAPGTATHAIASTLDIHPTIMAVAGLSLPTDRVFDGMDLSPVLFAHDRDADSVLSRADKATGHACYFFYRAATWANATEEIYAVRCGDHKVYWRTWGVLPPEGSTCKRAGMGGIASSGRAMICDPPLMFDLASDPGENTPLHSASSEYKAALSTIADAKDKHIATLTPVEDQNGRGSASQYALCEDPDSQVSASYLVASLGSKLSLSVG